MAECFKTQQLRRLTQYLEGVEHTASRAAILLSGDVRVLDRALTASDAVVEMNPRRRARHIMFFMLSRDYSALRQQLGLAIPAKSRAST